MKKHLTMYQVDAFTDHVFAGNPAAVCPLDEWMPDKLMQDIAAENNLAETAYFIKTGQHYHIRWFTPRAEVDLCGHATLASAYVLFELLGYGQEMLSFDSRSGMLGVTKKDSWLTLDFPADKIRQTELTDDLKACFSRKAAEAYKGLSDYMLVFDSQDDIEQPGPDPAAIARLQARGIIITAPGRDVDFVSRFFAPAVGIEEDPVTGSAHTSLTPYWSKKLGKNDLTARQLSERGGYLKCAIAGERIKISGQAALYMKAEINTGTL